MKKCPKIDICTYFDVENDPQLSDLIKISYCNSDFNKCACYKALIYLSNFDLSLELSHNAFDFLEELR